MKRMKRTKRIAKDNKMKVKDDKVAKPTARCAKQRRVWKELLDMSMTDFRSQDQGMLKCYICITFYYILFYILLAILIRFCLLTLTLLI